MISVKNVRRVLLIKEYMATDIKRNLFAKQHLESKDIFTAESTLLPDWTPLEPVLRDAQLQEIASALQPATSGKKPRNVFLWGPTGTGKTTCAKHVLKQLTEYTSRVLPVYINCWSSNTRTAILSSIAVALQVPLPRRGVSPDELSERIFEVLKKEGKIPILVLDEFDQLIYKKEDSILYDFSRADENHAVAFGLICITNDSELLSKLDARIRSSLAGQSVFFKSYTPIELKEILRQRVEIAFRPGTVDEEVIALCAARGAKLGGDARVALQCLWLAGRNAQDERQDCVTPDNVRFAFSQLADKLTSAQPVKKTKEQLELLKKSISNEIELAIIDSLSVSDKCELTAGQLFNSLMQKMNVTDRAIRSHVQDLENKKIVTTVLLEGADSPTGKGKTRLIRLV